jgi:hypothetical protein
MICNLRVQWKNIVSPVDSEEERGSHILRYSYKSDPQMPSETLVPSPAALAWVIFLNTDHLTQSKYHHCTAPMMDHSNFQK